MIPHCTFIYRNTIFAALVCGTTSAIAADASHWIPNRQLISEIEAAIRFPSGAEQNLLRYTRYYVGEVIGRRQVIEGQFVLEKRPEGVKVVKSENELSGIVDGGCMVVNIFYDASSGRIVSTFCNGNG